MASPFERLHALAYRPYVATDRHDPAVFSNLAKVTGYPIPQEYLAFLREFPSTGMFGAEGNVSIVGKEKLSGRHDGVYSIDMLFAGCTDRRYDLIELANRPVYDGDMPRHVLLIGDNVGGNAFCLDLRPESFGQVYYWDHEHGADESGLHRVADDFVSFINGLKVYE